MKLARAAIVAAPLLTCAYGVIRLAGQRAGAYGPGLTWQLAHVANLVALPLFVPVVLAMARPLPYRGTAAVVLVTLVGIATSIVQFTVDIAAAVQAHDRAGMNAFTHRFQSLPGAHLAFYTVGPQLFYVGLVVLAIMLAVADVTPWWSPILVTTGVSLPAVTLDLIPIGAVLLLIGVLPLTRSGRVSELV